jgi:hypothetical protein
MSCPGSSERGARQQRQITQGTEVNCVRKRWDTIAYMSRASTPAAAPSLRPDAPQQVGDQDDDLLILWMLSLTPAERLNVAQGFADSLWRIANEREA